MHRPVPLAALALLGLVACSQGNVAPPNTERTLTPPEVRYPDYNPFAPHGEAKATWRPSIANRNGTIVKPAEPSSQRDRPQYEAAPWATGTIEGRRTLPPPGTF